MAVFFYGLFAYHYTRTIGFWEVALCSVNIGRKRRTNADLLQWLNGATLASILVELFTRGGRPQTNDEPLV